jgi:hypothetical protein
VLANPGEELAVIRTPASKSLKYPSDLVVVLDELKAV